MSVNKVNQNTGELSPISGGTLYADAPVGSIQAYGGTTAPWGWLLCQGQAVSRATYAELFNVIDTSFGSGDGSTTFNVPDLRGKTLVGYNSSETEFNALGKTGGEKSHILTTEEMPSHSHTQQPHSHSVKYNNGSVAGWPINYNVTQNTCSTWGPATTSVTAINNNTGGDEAHNNLQPYSTVNYIIKATTIALPSDFEAAVDDKIAALDVASVGGSGKYISAISETDGKISATATNLSIAPTSGSAVPITSGGVYSKLKDFVKIVTATGDLTLESNGQNNLTLTFTTPTGYTPIVATPRSAGSWAWGIIQISPVSIANQNVSVVVKSWLPTSGTYTISVNIICIKTM